MSVRERERPRGVGEIFDRAIDLVVRTAVVSIGIGCAFELTGALIEDGSGAFSWVPFLIDILVDLAALTVLVTFLDAHLDGRRSRPGEIVISAARRFPFAIATAFALALMVGFALLVAGIVVTLMIAPLSRANPALVVLVALVPALIALAVMAYSAAVAGLALTAIVLDTRSPFGALRVTFGWLATRRTCVSAMLVAGAAFAVHLGSIYVGAVTSDYLLGLVAASPLVEHVARVVLIAVLGGGSHVVNVAALVSLRRDLIVRRDGTDLLQEGLRAHANFAASVTSD